MIQCPFIDGVELEAFGCLAKVGGLISQPKWSILFGWRECTYMLVLLEFLASLRCAKNPWELDQHIMRFRLFNKVYNITVDRLGVKLGLYTNRELNTQAYHGLSTDFPNENVMRDFWPK